MSDLYGIEFIGVLGTGCSRWYPHGAPMPHVLLKDALDVCSNRTPTVSTISESSSEMDSDASESGFRVWGFGHGLST